MLKNKVVNAISLEGSLVSNYYFEDLESPTDSKCCALGALIKGLPEEDFYIVIAELKSTEDISSDVFGIPKKLNELPISSFKLLNVLRILGGHYGTDVGTLQGIQLVNDSSAHQNRKESVLSYIEKLPNPLLRGR